MVIGTTVPLLQPRHLLAAWRAPAVADDALAAPWLRDGDGAVWFSRAAWGLKAVVDGHRAGGHQRPLCLWLPDYLCNQAIWPLRVSDVELVFYPVGEDLQPHWQRCERMAAAGPPDLFLVVHYFGFTADLATARAFCDAFGAALIEDAAHVPAPIGEVGRRGDYVLYSLYKHFPIPDGGLLVVRPSMNPARAAILAAPKTRAPAPAPGSMVWLAKRLIQAWLPMLAARLQLPSGNFTDDPVDQTVAGTPGLSGVARRLLHLEAPSLEAIGPIAEARRVNERALRKALVVAPGLTPLFAAPGNDVAPYRAVFRAASPDRAAACFEAFQAAGNVVESWPDLPPEVRAAPESHAAALALRQTVLALPIHASNSAEELEEAYGGVL